MESTNEANCGKYKKSVVLAYNLIPPTKDLSNVSFEESVYPIAFCSNFADVPSTPIQLYGNAIQIKSNNLEDLEEFRGKFHGGIEKWRNIAKDSLEITQARAKSSLSANKCEIFTPVLEPPSIKNFHNWVAAKKSEKEKNRDTSEKVIHLHCPKSSTPLTDSFQKVEATSLEVEKIASQDSFNISEDSGVESKNILSGIYKQIEKSNQKVDVEALKKLKGKCQQKSKIKKLSRKYRQSKLSKNCQKSSVSSTLSSEEDVLSGPPQQNSSQTSTEFKASLHKKEEQISSSFSKLHLTPNLKSSAHKSQDITGISLDTTFGFKFESQDLKNVKNTQQNKFLTIMALECHVLSRPNLLPDPVKDQIHALLYAVSCDAPRDGGPTLRKGSIIVVSDCNASETLPNFELNNFNWFLRPPCDIHTTFVSSEKELLLTFVEIVNKFDPDICVGYEVQMTSWGYILERGSTLITNLASLLSRVPESSQGSHFDRESDEYGSDYTHQIHLTGRIMLNVWRLMRSEAPLTSYSFENVCYHILHQRIPAFSYDTLTYWWNFQKTRNYVINYYNQKCSLTIELLNRLDLVNGTSELARVFGIPFYDVLARGSQYRVESIMLRLTRLENMVAISPSVQQRARMKAPQWIPLTLEPRSRFYTDPVVVLDFQSLYPSIMIAYNYCYSTCLGNVNELGTDEPFPFGASNIRVPVDELESLIDKTNISPCGAMFVRADVRKGVLPTMLEEILSTRFMVKAAKKQTNNSSLIKVLHSRQLALKLIANVTFGYTSANFSGRMPCVEVGDSIVSKARETLEKTIAFIANNKEWQAEVVYGDTDSIFVHLPRRTVEQAFKIGREIAHVITQRNPKPIKLIFEKVYRPCLLQSKKRYVGYMYEKESHSVPKFDAKGIETVRRDGCPATSKILEKSVKILFESCDLSLVKTYVNRQMSKILKETVSISDFIFAKEYRGIRGYKATACVPSLVLTRKSLRHDPRSEPRVGERVPYVIVYGAPGLPLIQLARSPKDLLQDTGLRINSIYYIMKAILPPLARCFEIVGIDVFKWFQELPRPSHVNHGFGFSTLSKFFTHRICVACKAPILTTSRARDQKTDDTGYRDDFDKMSGKIGFGRKNSGFGAKTEQSGEKSRKLPAKTGKFGAKTGKFGTKTAHGSGTIASYFLKSDRNDEICENIDKNSVISPTFNRENDNYSKISPIFYKENVPLQSFVPFETRSNSALVNSDLASKNSDFTTIFSKEKFKFCESCSKDSQKCILFIAENVNSSERSYDKILQICRSCLGDSSVDITNCVSVECPVLWRRRTCRTAKFQNREIEIFLRNS